jgi:hypothetical protein
MHEPASVVVARGSDWEDVELGQAHTDVVYGRRLTWRTNDDGLSDTIRRQLISRWASLDIPHAGPDVSASAIVVPGRYFAAGKSGVAPGVAPEFTDFVARDIGYQLVGRAGFGTCAWDRCTAAACMSSAADRSAMVERLVQHVWSAAVMWHPPLYGLHAAAVVGPDGRATLLVGDSRVGKSSLATYLSMRCGFRYLTDDLTILDARSLLVYGRPWRVELRPGALEALWDGPPPAGAAHGDKLVLDARAHVPVAASAPVSAVMFLRRGDAEHTRLDAVTTLDRLGKPVSMFRGCAAVTDGYGKAFSDLADRARGFALGIDHTLGIEHAGRTVIDALSA